MQGVEAVSQEVSEPMGRELRRVVTEARLGRPLEESLDGVAERMDSGDFAWAVMAIRIQREVGGNLAELLVTVADTMTERERLRRDVNALTAEGKISAIVLGLLPVGLGLFIYTANPGYMDPLFEETIGKILLFGSILLAVRRVLVDEEDDRDRHLMVGRRATGDSRMLMVAVICMGAAIGLGPVRGPQPGRGEGRRPVVAPPARRLRGRVGPGEGAPRPDLRARPRAVHDGPDRPRQAVHAQRATSTRCASKLISAGKADQESFDRFLAIRVVTVVLAPIAAYFAWTYSPVGGIGQLAAHRRSCSPAFLMGPDAILNRQVEERQYAIRTKLPDVMDLLVISVEAGLGFEQALDRTVAAVPGPLTEEFARMLGEVRAGASRADAMRALDARTNVPEIRSFVLAILQADTFGVSIGRVLRAQADEMRIKRRQLAQERAQKAPVKMLIPMVFCIFPALFVIVLGPGRAQHR